MDSYQPIRKETKMEVVHLNQKQLAARRHLSEAYLERWRSEGIGPIYMKMMGRVRYRLSDITDFEEDSLCGSTSQRASACSDR
jgi:hypothetical protein